MKLTNCLALQLLLLLALTFAEGNVLGSVQSVVSSPQAAGPINIVSNGLNGLAGRREAIAAYLRQARVQGGKVIQSAKTYIPPGLGPYLMKQVKGLAVKEGTRFAMKHPKETADIVGIAGKVRSLQKLMVSKVKKGK